MDAVLFLAFVVGVFMVGAIPGYILGKIIVALFSGSAEREDQPRRYIRRTRYYKGAIQVDEIQL